MTPPRLHVLTALQSERAVVLRRGPSDQVAALSWDRRDGTVELGQWLKGRIHEYRCDLSPSGRHLIYFACRGGRCWTALSTAPWLTAIACWPQPDSWFGGGSFTGDGALCLNGRTPEALPDGLKSAANDAFPHSTDGFHMGELVVSRLQRRGWSHVGGEGYEAELRLTFSKTCALGQTFAVGDKNRSLISSRYALHFSDGERIVDLPGWEWADRFGGEVQWAENGALWQARVADGIEDRRLVYDFSSLQFEATKAPYAGVPTGALK